MRRALHASLGNRRVRPKAPTRGLHHADSQRRATARKWGSPMFVLPRNGVRKPRERLCRRGAKYFRGDFSPRKYDVHPQTRISAFGSRRESDGGARSGSAGPFCSGFTPPRRPSGYPKRSQLGPRPLFGGKSVRRNSGLDGAQGAPMPLAPVVMVEFVVSGFVTVGSSALRGAAPLRTAATANADPGTSQIIAV